MAPAPLSLLDRLRRAEEGAWERFVDLYTPLLYFWALRAGVPAQDAGDLVHDVFTTLLEKLPAFVYDPAKVAYADLLKVFWENHDPSQGMRQGNDIGTQYRSAIYYTTDEQREAAEHSAKIYGEKVHAAGYGDITTDIAPAGPFFYAEDYHQQYLYKVPHGYRCHANTGIDYPIDH